MWTVYKKQQRNKRKKKETGDSRYICQNKLDHACFQHEVAYGDFKDLARTKKYDGCQRGLASMIYNFLIKNPLLLHGQKP